MMFHNLSIMHETFQATLRKDFYEKDVHVYWAQGNLKGKKLSLGHCTDMQVFGDHVTLTLWKSTLISLVNSWFKFWALLSGISSLFPFVSSPRKRYRESTAVESESSADDADPFDTSMEIDEWDHMEIKPSAGWVIVQIESLWITQSKSKPIISLY